jgi:transposase
MRGIDHQQADMFSYLSPEARVRNDHPLRAVRSMTDEILSNMSPLFDAMYAEGGRPSIPPEKLLRAQLLQMFFSVRSERLLMEEIDYSILYRWFVGLNLDEPVWDATTFTKNRDRTASLTIESQCIDVFGSNVAEQKRCVGRVEAEPEVKPPSELESFQVNNIFNLADLDGNPDYARILNCMQEVNGATIVGPVRPVSGANRQFRPLLCREIKDPGILRADSRKHCHVSAVGRPSWRIHAF